MLCRGANGRGACVAGVPRTSTAGQGDPGGSPAGDKRFSVVEMGVLGGVLGALLLLALIALTVLIHKHYGHRLKCCSGKALVRLWGLGTGEGQTGQESSDSAAKIRQTRG